MRTIPRAAKVPKRKDGAVVTIWTSAVGDTMDVAKAAGGTIVFEACCVMMWTALLETV